MVANFHVVKNDKYGDDFCLPFKLSLYDVNYHCFCDFRITKIFAIVKCKQADYCQSSNSVSENVSLCQENQLDRGIFSAYGGTSYLPTQIGVPCNTPVRKNTKKDFV